MFKNGLHYLFKDVDKTYKNTHIVPIVLYDDLIALHAQNKIDRKRQKILHKAYEVDVPTIPQWMLNIDEDNETDDS